MKTNGNQKLWLATMAGHFVKALSAFVLVVGVGAALDSTLAADAAAAPEPLRVGITPEYPPLVFRLPDATNGLEIDLAKALGRELGRPIEFVVVPWEDQIPALLERRTDIIMSGMSITKARQLRITFSNPYVQSQLRAVFPRKNAARFKTVEQVLKSNARIGVVPGTTGEVFAKRNCPNASVVPITMRRDVGVYLVKGDRIDLFIDDTFAVADILSRSEADIAYLQEPLSKEDLAWGIRPGDTEFLNKVNKILEQWKMNGTLERALDTWIPYLKKMRSVQPGTQASTAN